jgi:hypothetical protein
MTDALPDYSRAIEALPENDELYRARAHVLQRLGKFAPAMDDLNRAIELATPSEEISQTPPSSFSEQSISTPTPPKPIAVWHGS